MEGYFIATQTTLVAVFWTETYVNGNWYSALLEFAIDALLTNFIFICFSWCSYLSFTLCGRGRRGSLGWKLEFLN